MTFESDTYTEADLWSEDQPTNLHDDANNFYRKTMNLTTPIKNGDIQIEKLKAAVTSVNEGSEFHPMLSKLRRTPWKNLWPTLSAPPDHFIGYLWKAVMSSFGGKSSDIVVIENDDNDENLLNLPYIPLDHFLDLEKKLLVDNSSYLTLLQDKGFSCKGKTRPKKSYVTKDSNGLCSTGYKDIYTLATMYYDILNHNKKTFSRLPKNKSAIVQKVCKLLVDNRELKGYGDVDDEQIRDWVEGITSKDENPPTYIYIYDQRFLFTKLYNMWCPLGIEREEITMNDKLRVFGIMTSAQFRDEMDCLVMRYFGTFAEVALSNHELIPVLAGV